MAKYAVLLDVRVEIEAEDAGEASDLFWGSNSLAHYIDGVDVITDVEEHAVVEIEED